MEIKRVCVANKQYFSVIRFLVLKNIALNEVHRCITAAFGSEVMSVQDVRKWYRQFKNGWTSVFDGERVNKIGQCAD